MAIDLTTLNATEIILQKAAPASTPYRINQSAFRENWEEKKASAADLIGESRQNGSYRESASLDGAGISGITAGKGASCNYSLDAFFRKDMPLLSDESDSFTVGGASFTREELEECRAVMKAAVDGIGCGIGKNTNIDYRNYAEMELAAGGVKAYAGNNLTEKQAAVVNKAMQEYNDALLRLQKDALASAGATDSTEGALAAYYGKVQPVSEELLDRMRGLYSKAGSESEATATVQTATNEDLIGRIRDLFSAIDYSDPTSLTPATEQYRELLTPVKMALGGKSSDGYLAAALDQDVSGFQTMFRNMMNIIKYHTMDFKV